MDKNYFLSRSEDSRFKNRIKIFDYYLNYDDSRVTRSDDEGKPVVIIGEAIDIMNPKDSIKHITNNLSACDDLEEMVSYSSKLLGRYLIILFKEDDTFLVIPDASCSIPVNYYKEDTSIISSSSKLIAEKYNLVKSETSIKIKKNADNQHPLPFNVTMYEEVLVLIPNHYLESRTMKMRRYYPSNTISENSFDDVVDETIAILDRVIEQIVHDKSFALPITAGIDSRTLLALFKEHIHDIPLYTFYDDGELDNWDIKVPKMLQEKYELDYHLLKRVNPEGIANKGAGNIVEEEINKRILKNAYTLSESDLSDKTFLAGDIIPIAKSNFGRDLPEKLATVSYLVTKTHNFSEENKSYIKEWIKDSKDAYNISRFDLFFWEHRVGRWLQNNANNYDAYADPFYLFNCHYLIELWISVPRHE